jgi:hypothetical protein
VQPTPRDDQDNTLARLAGTARRARQGEAETVLGPPKMNFTSNNRNQVRTDPPEKRTPRAFGDDATSKERSEFQDGFFRPQNADGPQPREKQNGAGTRRPRESGMNYDVIGTLKTLLTLYRR